MMTPFPLPLEALLTKGGAYFVYLLIGIGFGYALEISGFAISTKLAAQFYFKDMTVLKVMFTAIVVGSTYTYDEIRSWLEEAGFANVRLLKGGEHMDGLVEAFKA